MSIFIRHHNKLEGSFYTTWYTGYGEDEGIGYCIGMGDAAGGDDSGFGSGAAPGDGEGDSRGICV